MLTRDQPMAMPLPVRWFGFWLSWANWGEEIRFTVAFSPSPLKANQLLHPHSGLQFHTSFALYGKSTVWLSLPAISLPSQLDYFLGSGGSALICSSGQPVRRSALSHCRPKSACCRRRRRRFPTPTSTDPFHSSWRGPLSVCWASRPGGNFRRREMSQICLMAWSCDWDTRCHCCLCLPPFIPDYLFVFPLP